MEPISRNSYYHTKFFFRSFFVNATMYTNACAFLRERRTSERDIPIL